ncbi:MAG: GGDEF domain-containing protein [Rhizobiaceae bacterium]
MKSIFFKALTVSTFAVVLAYALIIFAIPMFGEEINPSAWVLGFVGPYLIGMPVSYYCFLQADRLRDAHEKLLKVHEELRQKSMHDPMTGMLNRETFLARLNVQGRHTDDGVLLIADADHFKRINDSYGHLEGDKALLLIADAIKLAVREQDVVGRIGGEEFAVFLSGASLEDALEVSERIRRAVEEVQFKTSCGKRMPLTISAGGASTLGAENLSQLMRSADRSLYEAKRSGRNRVIFHSDMKAAA